MGVMDRFKAHVANCTECTANVSCRIAGAILEADQEAALDAPKKKPTCPTCRGQMRRKSKGQGWECWSCLKHGK